MKKGWFHSKIRPRIFFTLYGTTTFRKAYCLSQNGIFQRHVSKLLVLGLIDIAIRWDGFLLMWQYQVSYVGYDASVSVYFSLIVFFFGLRTCSKPRLFLSCDCIFFKSAWWISFNIYVSSVSAVTKSTASTCDVFKNCTWLEAISVRFRTYL